MKKSKKVLLVLLIMMFIPGFVFAAPEDDVITPDAISPAVDTDVIPGDTMTDGDVLTPDAVISDGVTPDTVFPDGDTIPSVDSVPSTELTDPITEPDTTGTTGADTSKEVKTTVVANPVEEENNDILYMSILGGVVVVTIIAVVALYKKSEQA